jgi:hypothetical protein
MREIRIFGMRRSGNHAIIEWIARHFHKTLHYNECWGWEKVNCRSEHIYGDKNSNMSPDLIIYSYEDFCPSIEEAEDARSIIILRDWYNMMSSRIISGRDKVKYRHHQGFYNDNILETWLEYIKVYELNKDKTIIYNKWSVDSDYRISIAKTLNLKNISDDKYIKEFPLSKIGNGSSFEKDKINTELINERYKLLKKMNNKLYKEMLKNEVVGHCKTIFNIEILDIGEDDE